MSMITVLQAAEKWGVAPRTVQNLCLNGRIPGAERHGRDWMIPADAQRPADKRTKVAKMESVCAPEWKMPKKTPLLIVSDLYKEPGTASKCIADLSVQPEAAALFEAWLRFLQGDAERAVQLVKPLLSKKADFYGTLGLGCILCACAIWIGDMALFRDGRMYIANAQCADVHEAEVRDYWLNVTDAGLVDHFDFVDWKLLNAFDLVPKDSGPAVCFYYAKYIHKTAKNLARGTIRVPNMDKLALCRVYPFMMEPIIAQVQQIGCVHAEIVIRLLCADIYYSLDDKDSATKHLDAALALAIPDKLYGVIAEFRVLYSDLFDERLAILDAEAAADVKALYRKIVTNFTKIKDRPLTGLLTDREYEIAQFVALGMTNPTIAKRLHISESTVKTTVSTVMDKLGATKRAEIGLHIF